MGHVQDMGRAVDAGHVFRQALQPLAVYSVIGQYVDALAQHRATQGFERAQHAHPARGIVR